MDSLQTRSQIDIARRLVRDAVPSRVHQKDATLYSFSEAAQECAESFMGWTDLASNAPCSPKAINKLAKGLRKAGMRYGILIGQGGSTQATMTMTKLIKDPSDPFRLFVLDSDSPVRLRSILGKCDLKKTVVIVSSKSGSTLEMRLLFSAVRQAFLGEMNEERFCEHLVAITDPGSQLATRAKDEGWAGILYGEPSVGGRFSALSVFGLFPAALVGLKPKKILAAAAFAERACRKDTTDNPAVVLAAFLYAAYEEGRNKLAFVTEQRGRALGLWVEQLLAESTGKDGQGILPYLETAPLLLATEAADRVAVTYTVEPADADARADFTNAISYINSGTPRMDFRLSSPFDLVQHFVIWEYATAFLGYLMKVCPFDQPDVASAKAKVLEILSDGLPVPSIQEEFLGAIPMGMASVQLSACCADETTIYSALKSLFSTIAPDDYFALNAFLPFVGSQRKSALESIRMAVGEARGIASCLEIGPRFLHSTGQLQKGGPDQGVFLVLSAAEDEDVPLEDQPAESLAALAQAQAAGDALTLSQRGRRCVHLHLPNNYSITLEYLAALVREVLRDISLEEAGRSEL